MKSRIIINPEDLKIVQQILKKHLPSSATVRVFGSRVTGTNKKFSDLDLAINADPPLSLSTMADLLHDFEESNLPYKVDIVDWSTIDESFKEIIRQNSIVLEF